MSNYQRVTSQFTRPGRTATDQFQGKTAVRRIFSKACCERGLVEHRKLLSCDRMFLEIAELRMWESCHC